ncbi:MAG TPA: SDR family oxidoreductase [Segeticoccus sp.]|uniref:SDR family oxidoreductase n=1 Tax=Segeticoccus sp. TaxID=2706531 RepID=UPI002D7FD2CE|nr:SDR family oxidoreductase [Segeticoccus sp.]HET8601850.1 SDR family oxidoreductase [Segeticoccus sp.]
MARVVIVGGHGKVAQQLIHQLSDRGDTAVATVRNPDHVADVERLGGQAVQVDLEQDGPERLAEVFQGADAVVFSAGAGADGEVERKRTVDLQGSLKSIAAAEQAGVSRFVQVSAISVDRPVDPGASEVWKAYVAAKRDADAALRRSRLDWTILRPGGLTDEEGTGRLQLADEVERGSIPRADVAALIVAVLDEPTSVGRQWEAVSGDQPIADALAAALA